MEGFDKGRGGERGMKRHVRTQVELRMRVERVGEARGGRKRKGYEGRKEEAGGEVTRKDTVRTKTAKRSGMEIAGSV